MNAKDTSGLPATGHFSISVIDENKVPADEVDDRNILTDLLLTSDLTGYVEQPNYYFYDTTTDARHNLDLLMLTQGYRSFDWKKVLNGKYKALAYQPERGLEISGRVTNLFGKPVANGTVTLIPSNGGSVVSSVSDSTGMFHFYNLVFTDSVHFVLSAVNSKGNNTTKITYLNTSHNTNIAVDSQYTAPAFKDIDMSAYLYNMKKVQDEYVNYGPGKGKLLKPVILKPRKIDNRYRTQSLAGAGNADQVMHADEIGKVSGQLSTSLNGRLLGVGFQSDGFYYDIPYLQAPSGFTVTPMLVVIDGNVANRTSPNGQILGYGIDAIPMSQVETIEVLKSGNSAAYGMQGGNGVLIITTKQGDENFADRVSIGVLPVTIFGFDKARTFYSPKV